MATTSSDPSPPPPHHSPSTRRPRAADSSPWTQIVRGIESEIAASVADQADHPDHGLGGGGEGAVLSSAFGEDSGSKAVWKKPAPGGDVAPEVSPLMGVAAWPALSESTKAGGSTKNVVEGSSPIVPQWTGMSSSSPQRQGNNTNTNTSSHTNNTAPTRQRSFRRGNGGYSGNPSNNVTSNGGFSMPPPSQGYGAVAPPNNTVRPANLESLSEENPQKEGGGQRGGFGPQSNNGGEYQQRNSYRRGTSGPHPRGDGSHYHNQGGRRDQDRGNQERNPHRNVGGRGAHMQPQRGSSRPFIRGPPHVNTSFVHPPPFPVNPSFVTPMVYPVPEVYYFPGPHQDPFRAGPMVPPMGPVFYPVVDPLLQTKILNQIEYYFSTDNIVGDTYLRKNMDEQGWVSIKLIAGFNKVSQLTDNIQLIRAALQASRLLEVEGDKLRRRDDWERWIMPPSVQHIDASSPQAIQGSGQEMLAAHLQNVKLDEKSVRNVDHENHPSRSSTGELSSQ